MNCNQIVNEALRMIGADRGFGDSTCRVKFKMRPMQREIYEDMVQVTNQGRKFVKSRVVEPKQIKGDVI